MRRFTRSPTEGAAVLRGEELERKGRRNRTVRSKDWLIASTVLGLDDPFHHVRRGLQSFLLKEKTEGVSETGEKEFSRIRRQLGKMERQMAQLLAASVKAIQSFEQGWRDVPGHTKGQLLFLMALKSSREKKGETQLGDKAPL
jgi:DNA-binding transcriptional regulator YiaG